MNNQPAKDWKSIDEQIEILRDRGMIIEDEARASHLLMRIGYYRLSGYWYPFRQFNPDGSGERIDQFIDGTTFENVVGLYLFDRKLRLLALDAIERIELAIQVQIAHVLGERDQFAHENPTQLHTNFSRQRDPQIPSRYDNWLEGYHKLVERSRRKTFVAHNLTKYGRLPIWVAIEVFDFGCLSKLYSGLKHNDKLSIERQFGLNNGNEFQTWLRSFNFIRNMAAHHSRLWNCNVLDTARIPHQNVQLRQLNVARPFLYFCMMQKVLKVVSPNSGWGDRFVQLMSEFPEIENGAVSLSDMGAVNGWENWRLWQ